MTKYVTELYEPAREPAELQAMHSHPKTEPQPDHHREDRSMPTATRWAPTRDELDQATDRTARAMADPSVSAADRERMAALEERAHNEYLKRPGANAELQREAEHEWEAGA